MAAVRSGSESCAYAVNGAGWVVGQAQIASGAKRAFVSDGTMWDLNRLVEGAAGWALEAARDINDAGQIVGSAVVNGRRRAFLLTPRARPSEPRPI